MPIKNDMKVATLIVVLFAPAAYPTNGYMSHGYGTTSKGMAGAGMALPVATKNIVRSDFVDFFAPTIVRPLHEYYRPPHPIHAAQRTRRH